MIERRVEYLYPRERDFYFNLGRQFGVYVGARAHAGSGHA